MELEPEALRRCAHLAFIGLRKRGIGGVDQQSHGAHRGDELMQQFQSLRGSLHHQYGHARGIAAGPVEAGNEAEPDRVGGRRKHDRNGRSCRLCRQPCRSGKRRNRGHLVVNQIGRQSGKPLILIPGETIFDSYVLTLDKACVFETLTERDQQLWSVAGRH